MDARTCPDVGLTAQQKDEKRRATQGPQFLLGISGFIHWVADGCCRNFGFHSKTSLLNVSKYLHSCLLNCNILLVFFSLSNETPCMAFVIKIHSISEPQSCTSQWIAKICHPLLQARTSSLTWCIQGLFFTLKIIVACICEHIHIIGFGWYCSSCLVHIYHAYRSEYKLDSILARLIAVLNKKTNILQTLV